MTSYFLEPQPVSREHVRFLFCSGFGAIRNTFHTMTLHEVGVFFVILFGIVLV